MINVGYVKATNPLLYESKETTKNESSKRQLTGDKYYVYIFEKDGNNREESYTT